MYITKFSLLTYTTDDKNNSTYTFEIALNASFLHRKTAIKYILVQIKYYKIKPACHTCPNDLYTPFAVVFWWLPLNWMKSEVIESGDRRVNWTPTLWPHISYVTHAVEKNMYCFISLWESVSHISVIISFLYVYM